MSIDRLDWDLLRVFRVVAELSSMNAAASRLGESAPTVGRKIDDLETSLGAKVFVRTPRGVELTDAGKLVLRHVHAMAEAAERLSRETNAVSAPATGTITLATGDGVGPYWIAPRLSRFHDLHPRVQVRMIIGEKTPDLLAEDADIAISFEETRPNGVIAHRLGVQHYAGFASAAYLAKHERPQSLLDYHRHRCILHTSYVNQVQRWAPQVPELRKLVDFAFITNSGTAIAETCANGGGVGILPSYMGLIDRRLVALELPELAPVQFWITYTERVRRLPQGRLMIEWLRKLFQSPEAIWFAEEFVHPLDYEAKVTALRPDARRKV